MREYLGADVAVLRDRTGGVSRTLTLREFRARGEGSRQLGIDWGGCGCFLNDDSPTDGGA